MLHLKSLQHSKIVMPKLKPKNRNNPSSSSLDKSISTLFATTRPYTTKNKSISRYSNSMSNGSAPSAKKVLLFQFFRPPSPNKMSSAASSARERTPTKKSPPKTMLLYTKSTKEQIKSGTNGIPGFKNMPSNTRSKMWNCSLTTTCSQSLKMWAHWHRTFGTFQSSD